MAFTVHETTTIWQRIDAKIHWVRSIRHGIDMIKRLLNKSWLITDNQLFLAFLYAIESKHGWHSYTTKEGTTITAKYWVVNISKPDWSDLDIKLMKWNALITAVLTWKTK